MILHWSRMPILHSLILWSTGVFFIPILPASSHW